MIGSWWLETRGSLDRARIAGDKQWPPPVNNGPRDSDLVRFHCAVRNVGANLRHSGATSDSTSTVAAVMAGRTPSFASSYSMKPAMPLVRALLLLIALVSPAMAESGSAIAARASDAASQLQIYLDGVAKVGINTNAAWDSRATMRSMKLAAAASWSSKSVTLRWSSAGS